MIYVQISEGLVIEVIEPLFMGEAGEGREVPLAERYTPEFVAALIPVPEALEVQEGWRYEGGEFLAPSPAAQSVPSSVTMRQARLALLNAGKLQAVDEAIAHLPSPQREAAEIEWAFASTVERDSAFLRSLASTLGLSDAALDELFRVAAGL